MYYSGEDTFKKLSATFLRNFSEFQQIYWRVMSSHFSWVVGNVNHVIKFWSQTVNLAQPCLLEEIYTNNKLLLVLLLLFKSISTGAQHFIYIKCWQSQLL